MLKSLLKKIVVFLLILEARLVLFRFHPKIVAVTGSVGKTTTKDMLAAVLLKKFTVRKSPKSFNSDIGIPLAILGIEKSEWGSFFGWSQVLLKGCVTLVCTNTYPEWLVLEVGADRPGDISRIARWLSPDCVVVTRFGETPVHLEFFPSREALIREKASLVHALKKDGVLVINADDPDVYALKDISPARVIAYGASERALFRFSYAAISYKNGFPDGVMAKIEFRGKMLPLFLRGTIGLHYVSSALAAFSLAVELEVPVLPCLSALREFSPPAGRMRILEGIHGTILIDDSYNSSPVALFAALDSLKTLEVSGRRIAVLGDMLELGKTEESAHEKAGVEVAGIVDELFTVGDRARWIEKGAGKAGLSEEHIHRFGSSREAGIFLKDFLGAGDAVLVKGSQGMRMEKAVGEILVRPEKKKELLVRQEEEWETR